MLGIAKLVRQLRPDDFYVVIASATIDPGPFLAFFNSPHKSLDVPGRMFDVGIEYRPPPAGISISATKRLITDHVVPCVIEAFEKYPEGHMLVFLPGQGEIEQGIKAFLQATDLPDVEVLPLFGSLPPEEQDKILNFDKECDPGQRMIVFTTNVAETSLTIPGVKIVVDLGLAKEVRFVPARKLQVIELVRISRSSANQRKGRAGRLSAG